MILADKIIELRKKNGWSQEDLAEKLDVSRQSISKWESGVQEPRAQRIAELAKLLDTTTAYLLGDSDDPSNTQSANISHTKQQSSKEHSINNGMLVYKTPNGERFEAPPTEIGIQYIERMRALTTN